MKIGELTSPLNQVKHYNPDKINVIRNTVAKGADDNELEMFLHLASQYNLDPLNKEIWFIKRAKKQKDRNGQWDYKRLQNGEVDYSGAETTIMTSRDGYLKIAHQHPQFSELNSMEIRENDDFHYNALTKEIRHNITAKRGRITGAWAMCKREDMAPAFIHVDFMEYKNAVGKSSTWDKYPSAMIRKIAEVIVLKRQFNISGLVTAEEMQSDFSLDHVEEVRPMKDITPVQEKLEALESQSPTLEQAPETVETEEPTKKSNLVPFQGRAEETDDYRAEWIKISHLLKNKLEILQIGKKEAAELFSSSLKLTAPVKEWTLNDLKKAIGFLNDVSNTTTTDPDRERLLQEYEEYERSQKVINQ